MSCVVFTGGGTGGHIFPGLAVAEVLASKISSEMYWLGNSKGIDKNIVESALAIPSLKFIGIPSGKLRRYFSLKNFIDVFKVLAGFVKSFFILLKLKPDFVFSKGGFVSVPPCAAAKLLKIPVITHECDFSPGLATKLNVKFAKNILVSYPQTIQMLPKQIQSKTICTGNPVRLQFYSANAENGKTFINSQSSKPVLLVLGGSLGAKQINNLIFESIQFLIEHFVVVHQTGEKNREDAETLKITLSKTNSKYAENYKPIVFIKKEMPDVLAASSIIVSRAGANSVWEAAATGKPMILIPLGKESSRGDQIENAHFFASAGAAEILRDEDVNAKNFEKILKLFLENPEKLKSMAQASLSLAKEQPAYIIADFLLTFLHKNNIEKNLKGEIKS